MRNDVHRCVVPPSIRSDVRPSALPPSVGGAARAQRRLSVHSGAVHAVPQTSACWWRPTLHSGQQASDIQDTPPRTEVDGRPRTSPCGCLFPKTHFCGLLVACQVLVCKLAWYPEDKERPEKEADHSGLEDGGFNKQERENLLRRLVLSHRRTKGSRYLPARMFNSLYGGLNLVYSHVHLSRLHPWKAPTVGMVGRAYIPRTGERVRSLQLPSSGS